MVHFEKLPSRLYRILSVFLACTFLVGTGFLIGLVDSNVESTCPSLEIKSNSSAFTDYPKNLIPDDVAMYSLRSILKKVANENKQLLVTFGTSSYNDLWQNFACSLRRAKLSNVLVVTTDILFYERTVRSGWHAFHYANLMQLPSRDSLTFNVAEIAEENGYKALMLFRNDIMRMISSLGYDFFLLDIDAVVMEDPLPLFKRVPNVEWDFAFMDETGDFAEHGLQMNAGCMYFRSSPKVTKFLGEWGRSIFERRKVSGDQEELNDMMCMPYNNATEAFSRRSCRGLHRRTLEGSISDPKHGKDLGMLISYKGAVGDQFDLKVLALNRRRFLHGHHYHMLPSPDAIIAIRSNAMSPQMSFCSATANEAYIKVFMYSPNWFPQEPDTIETCDCGLQCEWSWPDYHRGSNVSAHVYVSVDELSVHPKTSPKERTLYISLEPWTILQENFMQDKSGFDWFTSYEAQSDLPVAYTRCGALPTPSAIPSKEFLVAAFISNCELFSGRLKFLSELMQHIKVFSFGKCLNNISPEETDNKFPECKDLGDKSKKKICIMKRFFFALAFENVILPQYVTEKLYEPYSAGTVPVYRGAPDVDDYAPGDHSFVQVQRFSGPESLATYLTYLSTNRTAYDEYFTWMHGPVREKYQYLHNHFCTWYMYRCRVCMHYARNVLWAKEGQLHI
mmetsp:Transcript_48262/g.80227  ORF Transcript_48262/g.80227 Transcript_48262/m.80227 type:complete len:676 (-) Transcript_48262:40-2067(-)